MPVLYYILKLSVCLIVVWLFYQLVLRRLTFYTWNRWYLMVCTALAFLLPLIDISPVLEKNNWNKATIISAIPQLPQYNVAVKQSRSLLEIAIDWLPFLVIAGAIVMLLRLVIQYFSLIALRRSSRLLLNGPVKVYQVDKPVMPFSFGNAIYLNQHLHGQEELKDIIRHEFIHVKQRHTIDIIWSEAICILTWYNPFSWLIKKAIKQNLEFIADQQVLNTGLDRKQYQYLLLKVIGVPSFSIANNFNFKSLKKRIAMMNKVKSARLHLIRFLLLLPVVAVILLAFRNAAKHRQQQPSTRNAIIADTIAPSKKVWPNNVSSFRNHNNQVTVTLKDGKEEKYNFNNDEEVTNFEKKYGKMPAPPVPPIPPVAEIFELEAPSIMEVPAPTSEILFEIPATAPVPPLPPTQDDCYNSKGYCVTMIETAKGSMVLVLRKTSKETALFPIEDWDKKLEEKYGKLQIAPPPPPPAPIIRAYETPEGVSSIHVQDYDVHIVNENGTSERYNLRIAEDKAKYEKKYGPKGHAKIVKVHAVPATTEHPELVEMVIAQPSKATPSRVDEVTVQATEIHLLEAHQLRDGDEILAVITNNSTTKDLERMKTELKEKGITLDLINVKSKDGALVTVAGKISKGAVTSHFNAEKFAQILISIGEGDKGFHIYISDEKHSPKFFPSKN